MPNLPQPYIDRIQTQLGDEAEAFLNSYRHSKAQGLRINTLKINDPTAPALQQIITDFHLEPVPWCPTGYYYADPVRPGKHPFHAAGLYYIQEPSAMSAVELLAPQPGDIVLDLAAAPGGKSSQIAAKLQGKGFLICNEIHSARAKSLSENIERMGVANALVTNATPQQLATRFPRFFDKIMLDAPCSGEGMFRKDPDAIKEWSPQHVTMCAARQWEIAEQAVIMLKPGGTLAYSTCTFGEAENELVIQAMLVQYPELTLVRMERIWPHLHQGEGHFVAVLSKRDTEYPLHANRDQFDNRKKLSREVNAAWSMFSAFSQETIPGLNLSEGEPILFGEQLYWLPHAHGSAFGVNDLHGLKVLRPGLHLASVKKNRIEPAHALALAIGNDEVAYTYRLRSNEADVKAYLKGETLPSDREHAGWTVVTVDEFPLGWGKQSEGQLKNHYPKGLRWLG